MSIDACPPPSPSRYFNRYKKTIETEQVYGGDWLRWTYETSLGQLALGLLVKRAVVSRYYGWRMSCARAPTKSCRSSCDYDMDVDESSRKSRRSRLEPSTILLPGAKESARPVAPGKVAVLPADGRHLAFQDVDADGWLLCEGQKFDLATFLGDAPSRRNLPAARCSSRGCARWTITGFIFPWPGCHLSRG